MIYLAADNINTMNRAVAAALENLDPAPIRALARRCALAGASLIDVNPGYLSPRKADRMEFLVETIQEEVSARLILDSPSPVVLARGLAACRETPVISAVTLEPEKLEAILPMAAEHGADLVALLLDNRSVSPRSTEEKVSIALEIFTSATAAGLAPERLIFDPVLPSLSWPDSHDYVSSSTETIKLLADGSVLGRPARTMAGLSNLRSGTNNIFPKSAEIECLSALAAAGLCFPLMNVLDARLMNVIETINN